VTGSDDAHLGATHRGRGLLCSGQRRSQIDPTPPRALQVSGQSTPPLNNLLGLTCTKSWGEPGDCAFDAAEEWVVKYERSLFICVFDS
jgi:hypothetical protein